jgi:hypothetical protein
MYHRNCSTNKDFSVFTRGLLVTEFVPHFLVLVLRFDWRSSLAWNKAPFKSILQDFYYCLTVAGLLMQGALSDERTGVSSTIAADPVILETESRGTRDHILHCQIRNFPFPRLLWLAELRGKYSTPPPQETIPHPTQISSLLFLSVSAPS